MPPVTIWVSRPLNFAVIKSIILYKAHEKLPISHTKGTHSDNFNSASTCSIALYKHCLYFIKLLYVITKIMSLQFIVQGSLGHLRKAFSQLFLHTITSLLVHNLHSLNKKTLGYSYTENMFLPVFVSENVTPTWYHMDNATLLEKNI